MKNFNFQSVAAEAAVVNNVVAPEATSVEPAQAASLLEVALRTEEGSRKVQCKLFGRHFSSSTNVDVIQKAVAKTLAQFSEWQSNLQALQEEITKKKSADFLSTVVENAGNMTPEEIQAIIAKLSTYTA